MNYRPVSDFTPVEAAAYLAGLIDGEGTVTVPGKTHRLRRVSIANTDTAILSAAEQCCEILGIACKRYERKNRPQNWSPAWDVVIYGRMNLDILCTLVPLQAPKKWTKLKALYESYRIYRRHRSEWPITEIKQLYYEENWSFEMLAKKYEVSLGTVHRWFEQSGLQARSNSEGSKLAWQEGRR
jgi:hypothetical protein